MQKTICICPCYSPMWYCRCFAANFICIFKGILWPSDPSSLMKLTYINCVLLGGKNSMWHGGMKPLCHCLSRSQVRRALQSVRIQRFSGRCQDGVWPRHVQCSLYGFARALSSTECLIDPHQHSIADMRTLWCVYVRLWAHFRLRKTSHSLSRINVNPGKWTISWHGPLNVV